MAVTADGRMEDVHFDKITSRIKKLCYGLNEQYVDAVAITQKVVAGLFQGVTTIELDNLAAETAATMTTKHPDYALLAARIAVSNLHKETKKAFSDVTEDMYNWVNPKTRKHSPMVSDQTYATIRANADRLNSAIVYDRDFAYTYFGFKTLERSYLLKINGKVVERPQHMLMRVSIGIHGDDIDAAIETYNLLSEKWFTHASPTLFNAGTCRPQLSSCFLLTMSDDSIDGKEEQRARDLFYALWIPDLFMKRVESNGMWSLMCPHESPNLFEVWGDEFDELYEKYEREGRYRQQIPAQKLWYAILESQIETGTPYMLYKDACNRKSNQQNLGTIKCSNLCTEIVEYSSKDEVAVCNLASIALNRFVLPDKTYDLRKLHAVTKVVTRNLNKIIDVNYYPVVEAERSNKRHRPIGIGVQGLADAFILMRYPFDSPEAAALNRQIFETIYHAALESSMELAIRDGPYTTYEGSPVSKGILQPDMWNVTPTDLWDWQKLRDQIKLHGVRNSLLLAPMPTASTAQVLGNNESVEPYTSNIYSRRVLSGEFQVVNPHLLNDLVERNIWCEDIKNDIISANGSVQNIDVIPDDIKALYKTVWELSQKSLIDQAADRGAFIDQSQSLNIHIAEPNFGKLTSMHFYGWRMVSVLCARTHQYEQGLKTGMYYLRTKPAVQAVQFTVDKQAIRQKSRSSISGTPDTVRIRKVLGEVKSNDERARKEQEEMQSKMIECSLADPDGCLMCGS